MEFGYVIVLMISTVLSALAWRRILRKKDHWLAKFGYFALAAIPLAGPVFYMLIDPPDSTPIAVSRDQFWESSKGGGKAWPSFNPLINALRRLVVLA